MNLAMNGFTNNITYKDSRYVDSREFHELFRKSFLGILWKRRAIRTLEEFEKHPE
jgi:hypothetical protein